MDFGGTNTSHIVNNSGQYSDLHTQFCIFIAQYVKVFYIQGHIPNSESQLTKSIINFTFTNYFF